MGNLANDTAVEGSDGHYRGELSPDWEIWGPNGGYVASVALRAAAEASRFDRPASISCHYLSSGKFAPVDLEVVFLRQAKKAESLRVTMTQDGAPVLEAMVWMIDEVDGLVHDHAPMPDVAPPEDLRPVEELLDPDMRPPFSFFGNLEERPLNWIEDWENRMPGDPRVTTWFRFRPQATFDARIVDACRSLILVDTMEWPAAVRAHTGGQLPFIAPSLDLAVRFHRFEPESEWLLCDTRSPIAHEGLIGGTGEVYSASGKLLASGGQQMLCRPVPQQFQRS